MNKIEQLANFKIPLKKAVTFNRITVGLFFFLSGIGNYLNFNVENGFYQTVITQRLQLWGSFPEWWQGTPPLPAFIAVPYAWLLPLAEIVFGILFALGFWVRWTGLILILMTFSITIAFGIIPGGSLFANGVESFNKNLFLMTLIWMIIAYEVDTKKARMRRLAERMHQENLEANI
jgi:uncharacterized membrane protein YphA (DoxX/SURF4 family)